MKVSELRNELDTWDGEMELIVLDNNYMEHDIENVQIDIKGKEPKVALKID